MRFGLVRQFFTFLKNKFKAFIGWFKALSRKKKFLVIIVVIILVFFVIPELLNQLKSQSTSRQS